MRDDRLCLPTELELETSNGARTMAEDKNRHVKDYLTFYLSLPHSPHFAVMINGSWGIGKTYLVKQFLKEAVRAPDKFVYLSLFGLASLDEIDGALFESIYPLFATKAAKIGGRIIKAALKFRGVELDLKMNDVANKFSPRVFVFDDLERCEMPINKVMGYINQFVEHEGSKVIIIANEKEIAGPDRADKDDRDHKDDKDQKDRNEYRRRREKIVGKTLEVQSAFVEAFEFFLTQVDDPGAEAAFRHNTPDITAIYAQAELNNLRILQQTMWDFERLYRTLTEQHRGNAEAVTAILRLIFAFSFEIKAGRLRGDALKARTNWLFAATMEGGSSDAGARKRYPEVDLSDPIVSDEVLIDFLIRGIVDEKAIRTCLDQSRYFVTVASEPPWITVWHMFYRTENEFETAYKKMEEQFAARDIEKPGELLHVFALRLFLARNHVSGKTVAKVVDEGKRYIDDLYKARRLYTSPAVFRDLQFNGHAGLGFIDGESAEFTELNQYLVAKADQAAQDNYPQVGLQLLAEMETDPDLFLHHICLTNTPDKNLYYRVPVLASIDADKFVDTFSNLHPTSQRTVLRALSGRYEFGALERELISEQPWLEAVQKKLLKKASALPPIGKFRLKNSVEVNITRALDNVKNI
jgi:hypothetical protein